MRLNVFGDVNRALRRDNNLGVEFLDAQFADIQAGSARQAHKEKESRSKHRMERPSARTHVVHAFRAQALGALKLTFGASRSAGAETSKNSRGLKPSMLAKMFVGNC